MNKKNKQLNYGEAIYEGLYQSMLKNSDVFIYGQGVDDPKGHYGTTKNLHTIFGKSRCFDTPISEDSLTGIGIGAALAGLRPVFVHQRMDFLMLCMNQLINMASKIHYISDGKQKVPFVVRASIGRSWGQGAQHSQSLYSFFAHVPGLKVVAPTTPFDAKGMMISAIKDDNPVIFVEHRMLYKNIGYVPDDTYEVRIGKARLICKGCDVTLLGISFTVTDCLKAKDLLLEKNIKAEVIDLLSIAPIDFVTIKKSIKKTKKIIIVDNDWQNCGVASEILARIFETIEPNEENIIGKRLGYKFTPCPTTRCLEDEFYPSPKSIAFEAYKMVTNKIDWVPREIESSEIKEFKGPF
jgi:pyruvate dehydrogenase E1 component beta subunit